MYTERFSAVFLIPGQLSRQMRVLLIKPVFDVRGFLDSIFYADETNIYIRTSYWSSACLMNCFLVVASAITGANQLWAISPPAVRRKVFCSFPHPWSNIQTNARSFNKAGCGHTGIYGRYFLCRWNKYLHKNISLKFCISDELRTVTDPEGSTCLLVLIKDSGCIPALLMRKIRECIIGRGYPLLGTLSYHVLNRFSLFQRNTRLPIGSKEMGTDVGSLSTFELFEIIYMQN